VISHRGRRSDQPRGGIEENRDGGTYRLELGVVLLQAMHHGNDHRTHICTILGHHGIEYGQMDSGVWTGDRCAGSGRSPTSRT